MNSLYKAISPDDAEFLEKVQKDSKKDTGGKKEVFPKLQSYFIEKYGIEFGMLLLAAIMAGITTQKGRGG